MTEKLTCNLCGQEWENIPAESQEPHMMFHMVTNHPMDFLGHPKVQQTLTGFFENLGGLLADKIRGKNGKE